MRSPSTGSRTFSMGEYLLARYRRLRPKLAFRARNEQEWREWRAEFSHVLADLMGEWPRRCPLDAHVVERVQEDGYAREKVIFNAERDMAVVAYVLVPDGIKRGDKLPGLLCAHGHGNGKDDVCGIHHGEHSRIINIQSHNYDYARQFVRRGYVVIAPDWRGFGERRLGYDFPGRDGCNVAFIKALKMGLNPLTLNVWDAKRCLDYLQQRPEVDHSRLGCLGLSYGGTMTLFTAALDERVKAAIISCYLNEYGSYAITLGNFCGSQTVPGLLQYGEMADVAALIAPRPLLVEMGKLDDGFPIEHSRRAYRHVAKAYRVLHAPDRLACDEFDGGHRFSGRLAFDWMDTWLKDIS
ncbi:MAG: alpha/beta fold hydrolase [Armatimonadota bacterium]|nr:MAG: alpha/beta fold hydrolase [Armatimonadota bacterium]